MHKSVLKSERHPEQDSPWQSCPADRRILSIYAYFTEVPLLEVSGSFLPFTEVSNRGALTDELLIRVSSFTLLAGGGTNQVSGYGQWVSE